MTAPTYDVAIVGFGPTGAIAAALLGMEGLRVFVCDRDRAVYPTPRAISMDHEVLRVLQQIGVSDAVAPFCEPFTPSEHLGVDGTLIRRLTMVDPPYPLGHTPSVVFSQPSVEAVLRSHVAGLETVDVELGRAVVGVAQDADGVTLHLDGDAPTECVRSRWLVGCDGASSTVRRLVGAELEDLGFDEAWLVADVIVNELGLAALPTTSVQYCDPARPATYVIGPGRHRRWEVSLVEGEDPAWASSVEGTWSLIAPWISKHQGELLRQASYRFHALVASPWRRGRVFLAGDAAHQQPPFLGQGMCQGVRDVTNLAWKLVAVGRGGLEPDVADALLDSYETERSTHVRDLTAVITGIGSVICERDVAAARARDARMLASAGGTVPDTPRQDLVPALRAGWLSSVVTAGRGAIFPQPSLVVLDSDGQAGGDVLLDDLIGRTWVVITDGVIHPDGVGGLAPVVTVLALPGAAASRPPGHVVERDRVVAGWMERHACHAALVRPDGYVFGTARDRTTLDALVTEWVELMAGADSHRHDRHHHPEMT